MSEENSLVLEFGRLTAAKYGRVLSEIRAEFGDKGLIINTDAVPDNVFVANRSVTLVRDAKFAEEFDFQVYDDIIDRVKELLL